MPFILKEILFAAGAAALSLLFLIQSLKLPDSPALMPRILASLIIVLSAAMVWQGLRAHQKMVQSRQKEEIPYINIPLVTTFLFFIVAYVFSIESVGYFIATPLFIIGTYLFLRAMKLRNAIFVALGFCVLVYGVFVKILYLPVPLGLLENILG